MAAGNQVGFVAYNLKDGIYQADEKASFGPAQHVGYGRDLVGEIGLLTFTYAQTRHRGVGLIVFIGYLRSFFPRPGVVSDDGPAASRLTRSQFRNGLRRGRKAKWIVGADWEALLAMPLDEVRRLYNIDELPSYQAIRTSGAPVLDDAVAS